MSDQGTDRDDDVDAATLPAEPRELTSETPGATQARVGRYVLLDVVGRGAMGEVWSAFDPDLDRKVAIKLLRSERVQTEATRNRTLREARAMARLADPHVVAVHDVGVAQGAIFIAMEFIAGGTLRDWLEREHDVDAVLRMFSRAGRGLAAAHEQGLVHRDFKPANVLVGDDGRPRVADFGLVRAAEDDDSREGARVPVAESELADSIDDTASLTATGAVMGTPAFMSPEQWAGETPTAASDQFSFCVTLWRALAGQPPFAGTLSRLMANVCAGKRSPWPEGRNVPPHIVRALERGLSVDPVERHPSMTALLELLQPRQGQRWTLPVVGGTALAATVAIAVASSADDTAPAVCDGGSEALADAWGAARRDALVGARSAGEGPAVDAAVTALDAYAEAWIAAHRDACRATRVFAQQSEDVLERRMACLGRRQRQLDALVGALIVAPPGSFVTTVDAVARLAPVQPCSFVDELSDDVPLPSDPDARAVVDAALSAIDKAVALNLAGRSSDAQAQLAEAPSDAASVQHGPTRAELLLVRAKTMARLGEAKTSRPLLHDALVAAREAGAVRLAASIELQLANVDHATANVPAGLSWVELAEADARHLGDPQLLAGAARARTRLLHRAGDFAEALQANATERELTLQGGGGDRTLAGIADARANLLVRLGRTEEALPIYGEVLQLQRRLRWPGHPAIANVLNNRAIALQELGRANEAITDLHQALEIRRAAFGSDHPEVTDALVNLGNALREADRVDEALEVMAEAMRLRRGQVSADHPRLAVTHNDYAVTLLAAGRLEDAQQHYEAARDGFVRAYGAEHHMTGYPLAGLADLAARRGDHGRALELDARVLALRQAAFDDAHPLVVESREAVQRHRDALGAKKDSPSP